LSKTKKSKTAYSSDGGVDFIALPWESRFRYIENTFVNPADMDQKIQGYLIDRVTEN